MPQITILPFNKNINIQTDETVMEALRRGGYEIEGPCNGQGICGKCRIRVEAPGYVPQTPHRRISETEARKKGIRLACRLSPKCDISLHLPDDFSVDARILEGKHLNGIELKPAVVVVAKNGAYWMQYAAGGDSEVLLQNWRPHFSPKGLAIDVGTTTLVVTLFCLDTGKELSTASSINPQTKFGHDVLSRIQKGSTQKGLVEVSGVVREELNRLIQVTCKNSNAEMDEILDGVIGGNTTMLTLAAAINPESLGHLPFAVDIQGGVSYPAKDFGLDINPAGVAHFAASFNVERRSRRDDFDFLPLLGPIDHTSIHDQGHNFRFHVGPGVRIVVDATRSKSTLMNQIGQQIVIHACGRLVLAKCAAAAGFGMFILGIQIACLVDRKATLARQIAGDFNRQTVSGI